MTARSFSSRLRFPSSAGPGLYLLAAGLGAGAVWLRAALTPLLGPGTP